MVGQLVGKSIFETHPETGEQVYVGRDLLRVWVGERGAYVGEFEQVRTNGGGIAYFIEGEEAPSSWDWRDCMRYVMRRAGCRPD